MVELALFSSFAMIVVAEVHREPSLVLSVVLSVEAVVLLEPSALVRVLQVLFLSLPLLLVLPVRRLVRRGLRRVRRVHCLVGLLVGDVPCRIAVLLHLLSPD